MNNRIKYWLKRISPFALSKNHQYDRLTSRILKRYCRKDSNGVDIGAHEGDILKLLLRFAPDGHHWGFEPIPVLYDRLLARFALYPNCMIYPYALSDRDGQSLFNHVLTNPAYSGLQKRSYDHPSEKDEIITVDTQRLDAVIPAQTRVDIIKIDVEGGEYDVLRGANRILLQYHPLLIFEFGTAAKAYHVDASMIYDFLEESGYRLYLLGKFLKKSMPLDKHEFTHRVMTGTDYYFVAGASI